MLTALRRQTCILHLQITPDQRAQLFARYLREPKPLIWGDAWQPRPGESVSDARRRCYPLLLEAREQAYADLAELTTRQVVALTTAQVRGLGVDLVPALKTTQVNALLTQQLAGLHRRRR